jgi:phosphohistidine swiveling domain-containing protein
MKPIIVFFLFEGAVLGQGAQAPAARAPGDGAASIIFALPPRGVSGVNGLDLEDRLNLFALNRLLAASSVEPGSLSVFQMLSAVERTAERLLSEARALPPGADPAPLEALFSDLIQVELLLPPALRERINAEALALHKARLIRSEGREAAGRFGAREKEEIRLAFLSSRDPPSKLPLARVIASREFGFSNAMDLLLFLHPDYRPEIADYYSEAPFPTGEELALSVFADPGWAAGWVENVRRLKALSPEAYEAARGQHGGHSVMDAVFYLLSPGREEAVSEDGYRLPYPLRKERSIPVPGEARTVAAVSQQRISPEASLELMERYSLFDRLIQANFQVLETMSAQAGGATRSSGEMILDQTRRMAGLFNSLKDSVGAKDAGDPSGHLESIGRRLRDGWSGLPAGGKLPGPLQDIVFKLDPDHPEGALHSLVNWMHQKALSFFSLGGAECALNTGAIRCARTGLKYDYLGKEPLHEVLAGRRALKSLLAGLRRVEPMHDRLFFDENRVWMHTRLGYHSAEIFADTSDPDEGGMIRIRFKQTGCDGGRQRMLMIESFLSGFAMTVRLHGGDFLEAKWDKDNGLDSARSIELAFPLILKFFHETGLMDLLFGEINKEDKEKSEALARALGKAYFAEGSWPFPFSYDFKAIPGHFLHYEKAEARRSALRARLDAELKRLGLAPIPAEAPFGQRIVDLYYAGPIREALARGELAMGPEGVPVRASYSPLDDLAEPDRSAEALAATLNALDGDFLAYEPIGFVGALRAERAQASLDGGSILTVHALRERASGRLAYARASLWNPDSGARDLDRSGLKNVLWVEGEKTEAEEEMTAPQRERLQGLLRAPLPKAFATSAFGLPASPGDAVGALTFDRSNPARGAILAVPYASPDDFQAISRCAGVVATGGGALSHAAITTREMGRPCVILRAARWSRDGLKVRLTRQGPPRTLESGVQVAELSAVEDAVLREGDAVRIGGRTGEIELLPDSAAETKARPPEAKPAAPMRQEAGRKRPEKIRREKPSILGLKELNGEDGEFAGGKAAKLGEILQALEGPDVYVPDGIALTCRAYERFLEEGGLKEKVAELAAEMDGSGDVERLSADIRKVILSGRLDPDKGLGGEILDSLPGGPWAVRSSAVQEDTDDGAFAGAAESFLFVHPEAVLSKVVETWASFWLPRGIAYRKRLGLKSAGLLPAVLIQEMVPAEKSGVVFTRDPVASADEIVINAAYGLGEGVVSGRAEADSYTTRKSDGVETGLPLVARKLRQVESTGSGTRLGPVPKPLRNKRVLTREQTAALSKAAVSLEKRFGRAMDIEFSIHQGRIAILQARPITTP